MHDLEIYDVEHYQPFHFKAHLDRSYLTGNLENAVVFSNNGYFAISQERFDQLLNKNELMLLAAERLSRQGILIGKRNQDLSNYQTLSENFLKPLIQEEVHCLRYFLKLITAHLERRESEGQKLTNHDNVRILIGKVVQFIEEVEGLLELEALENPEKYYIAEVIRTACNHLAKLAGGRSFISFNVIEMLCTFEVLNKIYLN